MPASRREFVAASGAAALAALLRPRVGLAAFQQQAPAPLFTPLRRQVGIFTMRGGTIGWLVNPGAVVVVDSQFPAEARACLNGLNERSGSRPVDALINTHHHGDHTAGNVAFRDAARRVVAHRMAAEHMRQPPGAQPPAELHPPDTIFDDTWSGDFGDERVTARYYGRAHTSGDAVVTFERANVVHLGDLMFYRRHPVVDRAAGATIRNWMTVLDRTVADHAADTIYIFGHAGPGLPVTGDRAALRELRDYFGALLEFVAGHARAGRSRDEVLAMRDPLPGFESFGRFGPPGARDPLTCAWEEITGA